MPQTTVNTPDGGTITVNHPEGATRDQILRFAKKQFESRTPEDRRAALIASNPAEYDPSSPEFREKYGAQSENPFVNVAAGAGKFLFDRARGVGQLFGAVDQDDIDAARARDRDLLGTKAGLTGNILGGAAFTAPLALVPGVNTGLGASLAGAAIGATEPVASGESRGVNAAIGAAGGLAGQRLGRFLGGGRSVQADDIPSSLNRPEFTTLRTARDLGFRATPGQATGSRSLQQAEAALESKPFTSGPFFDIKDANQTVANRIAARAIGETDDVVDSATLGRAFDRMSGSFADFAENTTDRVIDPKRGSQFISELAEEFDDLTTIPVTSDRLIKRLESLVRSGKATGRQLQSLTSKLGKKANTQMTTASGDRDLGKALFQAKEFVDDLIEEGLDPAQRRAFQELRKQYRNYSLLTSRNNIINPSSGNVNLNALAGALQSKDKSGFLRGGNQSELYNAARFGQAFRPLVGDSGTATRSSLGPVETAFAIPFAIASRAYASNPSTALLTGGNQTLQNIQRVLGPVADPRIMGLLGASAATATN